MLYNPTNVFQYYIPTYRTSKTDFLNSSYNSYDNCIYIDGRPIYGAQYAVSGITYIGNGDVQNLRQKITCKLTYQHKIEYYNLMLFTMTCVVEFLFIKSGFK